MRDLQRVYMRLASALECTWTSYRDKQTAAILLRNAAVQTPHCHFCGCDDEGNLYESRYNPKARVCERCALEIAEVFRTQAAQSPIHRSATIAGRTTTAIQAGT
jgi:hypothetical protein